MVNVTDQCPGASPVTEKPPGGLEADTVERTGGVPLVIDTTTPVRGPDGPLTVPLMVPDWTGPGDYLIPLRRDNSGGKPRYDVQATPPSPGFPTASTQNPGPPRIYPATPQVLAQYHEIQKPR